MQHLRSSESTYSKGSHGTPAWDGGRKFQQHQFSVPNAIWSQLRSLQNLAVVLAGGHNNHCVGWQAGLMDRKLCAESPSQRDSLQSKKTVTAYLKSKQRLPFGFALQYTIMAMCAAGKGPPKLSLPRLHPTRPPRPVVRLTAIITVLLAG